MRCLSIVSTLAALALLTAGPAPARAACAGDCGDDGVVTIAELITLVGIALDGTGTGRCAAGDTNGDGVITIDELILAVQSALLGCPSTPTATASLAVATQTATPTGSSSATPSASPPAATATSTDSPAATAMGTASAASSATPTLTPSRTGSASATASLTATPSPSVTATHSLTASVTATATAIQTASRSGTPTRTATRTSTATFTATPPPTSTSSRTPTVTSTATATRTPTVTRTSTPSLTATQTATATPGLGTRHFSLDPSTSHVQLLPDLGTFPGFTGFLDLAVGVPDPVSGLARVDIVGASTFLSVQVGPVTLCIKPIVPVSNAGVLACNGGVDLGVSSSQDHNIGVVGVNGFTAGDCIAAGGTVETPTDPHPGVCNGPVEIGPSPEADSGVGALLIAPDARFGTQGLPAEVTIDFGACDTHGPGDATLFGFVSGVSRASISDANNVAGALFQHDEDGENFSCQQWMLENGPGRLVLSVPAVHGSTNGDLITVFVLDD